MNLFGRFVADAIEKGLNGIGRERAFANQDFVSDDGQGKLIRGAREGSAGDEFGDM